MSIADFFFGRKQNKTNSRRSAKLNRNAVRTRTLSMEPLETRDLLSVTTGLIDDSAYAALREQYPEFNLPAVQSNLNVMTVDCNLADLKSAITNAGSSTKSDLILVKTTDSANTITYSTSSDEISINVSGSVTIIGWGTEELTLDANQNCRIMSISGNTNLYLGNLTITKGKVTEIQYSYGGGIYNTSQGVLKLNNCLIMDNMAHTTDRNGYTYNYGGGIYTTAGKLSLTNCIISNNTCISGAFYCVSYGGGIYSTSNDSLSLVNCSIVNNSAKVSGGSSSYANGGGIYSPNNTLSLINCTIWNNSAKLTDSAGFYSQNNTVIYNSIIQKSLAPNINVYNSIISDSWSTGSNNIVYDTTKPLFGTDYYLADGSQAINNGNNSYAVDDLGQPLTTDLSGIPRILGSTVDIGAYEYDSRMALSVPEFTVVSNLSSATVDISPVDNVTSYRIEYSLSPDFSNSTVIDTQLEELVLEGLQALQTYYIRIKSVKDNMDLVYKDSDYSSQLSFFTANVLDMPTISTFKTYNSTVVVANWSLIDNADSYTFEYQLDGSDNWTITTGLQGTSTAFIGNIGSTYNVRVKANGTGNYSDSPYSEIASITLAVPPTPLSGLTLSTYAPEVGTTITASFEQSDITADYQWYCGTTIIDGATDSSFTVIEAQIGQTITCIATGTGNYTGTVSATTAVVPAFELDSPVLSSLNTVGSIVVAEWSDVDNADGYTLEYKSEDSQKWTSISGLSDTTAAFVGVAGTTYNVRVKANGTGTYSDSSYSAIASITLSVPLTGLTLSTTAPEVGTVITTTLSPSGATVEYQWYSGETEMDGATGSSFTVTEDQIGQTIMCVATGADGYTGTVSATTAVVPTLALNFPSIPELTLNGATVNAAWSAVGNASGYTLEYQPAGAESWSVITGISGATASFNGAAGATYNVRVKANGTGNYSDSEFSEFASIYIPIPLTGLTFSTTTPEVGTIITTTLTPSDATVDYQWYSNETIIEGAETLSFTVTEDYIGQTITCVATANGAYTGSVSATTAAVPAPVVVLDAPADIALSVYNATVTASWSAVDNASSYTLEYKPVDSENWTALPGLQDTTASFDGVSGTMYNVRVKANGTDGYSDSSYSEVNTDKPTGPVVAINLNKVTVSWVDDSPAADAVRYRVAGTAKWTVKKLKAGVTSLTFNASIGVNYDIEVLLDQQETNVLQGSAIVLDQPKLKADKTFLKDDTFQVEVTNYAAKNLAANVKQAIVSVNGVMTTLNISNQQGECNLVNGGKVAFDNGRFTFSEMTSNTSYKVQISFSDGHSVSKASSALTVKTTKTCYLAPVITSATAVSDASITVTWETAYGKGTNTPAQKYTVQYSLDGVKWTNATTAATGNSFTIQKLKGGSVYQVRVLASKDNVFEASLPSEVLTAETLAAPKTALNSTSVKDDSFQVNVTNYQNSNLVKATSINVKSDQFGETVINLENGAGSAAFGNGMTVAFNNGALTFANAPSNTQQKIQVNFSDGVCTTAWSAALTVKTAIASYNKPVLTSATADGTSIQVEWSSVVGKNSDSPAQSYTVQYTTDGSRWINANAKVVGTSYTITGLKTVTTYLVAVIANKDALFNASQPSESLQVRL